MTREREREKKREREKERESVIVRECARMGVRLCVFERVRERVRD